MKTLLSKLATYLPYVSFMFFNFLIVTLSHAQVDSRLEIINVRVGQGDATIIRGPVLEDGTRVNILMDAGNIGERNGGRILTAVLHKHEITRLDYIIVSHYDADHIGGIVSGGVHGESFLLGYDSVPGSIGDDDGDNAVDWIDSLKWNPDPEELGTGDDIKVGYFIDRGNQNRTTHTQAYDKYIFMAEAHNNRISLTDSLALDSCEIDLGGGAVMKVLAANGYVRDRAGKVNFTNTENEQSLSFLVSYKNFDYLISGDLIGRSAGQENAKIEAAVGDYIDSLEIIVDILHVNHHGANNASDSVFLEKIKPTIAVISVGNHNSHKHPASETLERLAAAKVYRIIQTSLGNTSWTAPVTDSTNLGDVAIEIPVAVRDIQAIYQNDIIIKTDGTTFEISTSRVYETDKNSNRNEGN